MGIIILFFSAVAGVLGGIVVGIIVLLTESKRENRGAAFFMGFVFGGLISFGGAFWYIVSVLLKDWNG